MRRRFLSEEEKMWSENCVTEGSEYDFTILDTKIKCILEYNCPDYNESVQRGLSIWQRRRVRWPNQHISLFSKYDASECLPIGLTAHSSQSPVVQKTCPICISHLISSVILVGLVVVEALLTDHVLFCDWSYWITREKLQGDGQYALLIPGRHPTASWNKVGFMYNKFICESDTLTRWSVIAR